MTLNTHSHKELGKKGEELAGEFLKRKGFRIRETNFRCPAGELDLIAQEKKTIVFVEVKRRSSDQCGLPEEAVDWHKQRKLVQVAQWYLQRHRLEGKPCRFDVVSILDQDNGTVSISHLQNAFTLDDVT